MDQWEYLVVYYLPHSADQGWYINGERDFEFDRNERTHVVFNALGVDGWELVGIETTNRSSFTSNVVFYFKRLLN